MCGPLMYVWSRDVCSVTFLLSWQLGMEQQPILRVRAACMFKHVAHVLEFNKLLV